MTEHILRTHEAGYHDSDDSGRSCPICDGGLAFCTVCHGAEGDLPTECPGVPISEDQRLAIVAGHLDFSDGMWRHPALKPVNV